MTDASGKPLPATSGLAGQFYEWCGKGELRFQRCAPCHAWRHVPREMCPTCGSWEWSWERSSGHGHVYTWTVVERALHPAFGDETPYAPVVVELEEGIRLLSRVVDVPPNELAIGLAVTVVFERVTAEVALPRFRRAD